MEQPAQDVGRDQKSSVRHTKLQELFRKFLQGALQCPSQQVCWPSSLARARRAAATCANPDRAAYVPCEAQRLQQTFEGLHPALMPGVAQLYKQVGRARLKEGPRRVAALRVDPDRSRWLARSAPRASRTHMRRHL
jgi:hypothetical protein